MRAFCDDNIKLFYIDKENCPYKLFDIIKDQEVSDDTGTIHYLYEPYKVEAIEEAIYKFQDLQTSVFNFSIVIGPVMTRNDRMRIEYYYPPALNR